MDDAMDKDEDGNYEFHFLHLLNRMLTVFYAERNFILFSLTNMLFSNSDL